MIEETLNQDLKRALLAGDKFTVSTLRTLKSAVLYSKLAQNLPRDAAMPDSAILAVLQKESKKRQESADLYIQGGSGEKAQAELEEKRIIERYLPAQLSEAEVATLVDQIIKESGSVAIGEIISKVKERSTGAVDGAVVARIVKGKLQR